MDIDLTSAKLVGWQQECYPWNIKEKTDKHKCAVKNISICKYFRGIEAPDIIKCDYNK